MAWCPHKPFLFLKNTDLLCVFVNFKLLHFRKFDPIHYGQYTWDCSYKPKNIWGRIYNSYKIDKNKWNKRFHIFENFIKFLIKPTTYSI